MTSSLITTTWTGELLMSKRTDDEEHPSRWEIARLAYELYEMRGRVDGHDVEDWLSAERELRHHYE